MPQAEVERLLGRGAGSGPDTVYSDGQWKCYVRYQGKQVSSVASESCLELDGVIIFRGGPRPTPEQVRKILGTPDQIGFAGAGTCEGSYEGFRYSDLNLTINFSLSSLNVILEPTRRLAP